LIDIFWSLTMPLKPSQILQLLRTKREQFSSFKQETFLLIEQYRSALEQAMILTDGELAQGLAGISECGAAPLEPLQGSQDWIVPFGLQWQNREESLLWVRQQLMGVSTFAVDGSQIYPGKDLSMPIALVQIGWFENLHVADGEYLKDIETDLMTPAELRSHLRGDLADRQVNLRRFQLEIARIIQYFADHRGSKTALAFFDGSLVASFAEAFDSETQQGYVNCICKLLTASEQFQVPVIGYIDTSSARDLITVLQHLYGLPETNNIYDAQLLNRIDRHSMQWGDRTPIFLCQRSGILANYGEHRDQIAFTYLKTNRDSLPARLEFPRWMYDSGRIESIFNWVRGEIIIGSGYPYVIETADQVAVVKVSDQQMFYRILQEWAAEEDLPLRLSRKMVSKSRRR
jgi:hypothetical protein